ncbi:MAG: MBL fold metallo-hydrolase [Planctomycetia bacterium]|nr:MBL fold metallo-hydrolase [Planctomycetia bacterium]
MKKKICWMLMFCCFWGLGFFNGVLAQTISDSSPALTLWQLPNQTHSQMMSYIIKTSNGQVIVIDGGCKGDADYLIEQIKTISETGKVDAWFLTHCHFDHVGAICSILTNKPDALTIEKLYYSFPPQDWLVKNEKSWKGETDKTFDALSQFKNKSELQLNQIISFGDDVQITVLNDFDLSITKNAINNSCIVLRLETPKTSILFLGDLGLEAGNRLMKLQPEEKIRCDVLQMAHHGQNGVSREFYELAHPRICLWPTPDWLWDNDAGKGYGTGPWQTLEVRKWMDELGVKEHYVEKDGLIKLSFE